MTILLKKCGYYLVMTKDKMELMAAKALRAKGIDVVCPSYSFKKPLPHGTRAKTVTNTVPILPGYIFTSVDTSADYARFYHMDYSISGVLTVPGKGPFVISARDVHKMFVVAPMLAAQAEREYATTDPTSFTPRSETIVIGDKLLISYDNEEILSTYIGNDEAIIKIAGFEVKVQIAEAIWRKVPVSLVAS